MRAETEDRARTADYFEGAIVLYRFATRVVFRRALVSQRRYVGAVSGRGRSRPHRYERCFERSGHICVAGVHRWTRHDKGEKVDVTCTEHFIFAVPRVFLDHGGAGGMSSLSFPPTERFARARARFVRTIVESLDETGRGLRRMRVRLSDRLNMVLSQVVTDADPDATLSLDDAESLLIEADVSTGKGFGSALEHAGRVFALQRQWLSRAVSPRAEVEQVLEELRFLLSRAVVGAPLVFEAVPTVGGVSLGLGVGARPRSARVLGHMAKGFVQAASDVLRAAFETRLEVTRDRATLRIEFAKPKERDDLRPRVPRPSSIRFHAVQGPLSAEVDRILKASQPPPKSEPGRDRER